MRSRRMAGGVLLVVCFLVAEVLAAPFVLFPQAGELVSPDGRWVVHNEDQARASSDFIGTFHSLWLTEVSTGRSRKLCDYVGVAAVGWSNNGFLIVTQYLSKKTSRALVFSASGAEDPIVLDKNTLIRMIPEELRDALRENDHVFVEASRIEEGTLHLRVWGYGQHDSNGFRLRCEYGLREGAIACSQERGTH